MSRSDILSKVVWSVSRVILLAALAAAGGCRKDQPPSILFVVIDALRADHVSSYGYPLPTTPVLDGLAARGVRFTDATAPSNHTHSSMPSIWTGLLPSRTGMLRRDDVLDQRFTTLAEILAGRGYRTGAWCPNPSLDRIWGIGQGFEVYDDGIIDEGQPGPDWWRYETASKINARALAWIDAEPGRPFFAWLHYRDVHGPYLPPPDFKRLFSSAQRRPITPEEAARRPDYLTLPDEGGDLGHYVAQYDAEIRYADHQLGLLLAELERRRLLERTVVVVVADHGEAFLDHGEWNHGTTLHVEELQVPLVIAAPALRPRVVERLVSTIDLFPTLVELAGAVPPPTDAVSLLPLLEGRDADYQRVRAFAENWAGTAMQRAVVDRRWKMILDPPPWPALLFDRLADPGERLDLAAVEPDRMRALAAVLEAEFGRDTPRPATAPPPPIDAKLRRNLEALGYVQ